MTKEFYKKHRPATLEQVMGQAAAVSLLSEMVKRKNVPHALLFSGPSGCGKTTLARIMRKMIGCSDMDFREINAAATRGIDGVRDIQTHIGQAPMNGRCRVWCIDEAHKLTGDAQSALLKTLEDTPRHVYFMLCTTDPAKLLKTIITRCTEVKCKEVDRASLTKLIKTVCDAEGLELEEDVVDRVVDAADGSARKALVVLDQIAPHTTAAAQLGAIAGGDYKAQGIEIARLLIKPSTTWGEMARVLKAVDEEPEGLRWMVLNYCTAILCNGKADHRCFLILDVFAKNFFDTKKAGLVAACFEVIHAKK